MGRSADSPDSVAAARRKVVLLRPHTAAADSAAGPERRVQAPLSLSLPQKPQGQELGQDDEATLGPGLVRERGRDRGLGKGRGGASGPAGRILAWLGKNEEGEDAAAERERPSARPRPRPALAPAKQRHALRPGPGHATSPRLAPAQAPISAVPTPASAPAGEQVPARASKSKPRVAAARHLAVAVKAARVQAAVPGAAAAGRRARAGGTGTGPQRPHAVNALKLAGEVVLRSASPCSPEPPVRSRKPVTTRLHGRRHGHAALDRAIASVTAATSSNAPARAAKRRASGAGGRSSGSSSPAAEARAPAPAAAPPPAKRRRKVRAAQPVEVSRTATFAPAKPVSPVQQRPLISALSQEGKLQAAVFERLREMCGEHEDVKVLAEYIVMMVEGNKGREEMTVELTPFFNGQEQAESFVDWVEECKWKFTDGGSPSPPRPATGGMLGDAALADADAEAEGGSPQRDPSPKVAETSAVSVSASPSPAPSARSKLASSMAFRSHGLPYGAGSVFEVPPLSSTLDATEAQTMQQGKSFSAGPVFSKAAAAARTPNANNLRQKTELLKNMTKQLQVILTKLSDKSLNDGTREKYQALAQSIQTQMAKISKPQVARRRP